MGTVFNSNHLTHHPLAPSANNDDSQCDTIYDEDGDEGMTEEEEGNEDDDQDDDNDEEDEEQTITDESSTTCTQESSNDASEEISLSNLSPEIHHFARQFPGFCEQFQIISKIGEGTGPIDLRSYLFRHI